MDNCGYPMWMVLLSVFIASFIAPYVQGFIQAARKDHKRPKKSKLRCKHKNITEFDNETFCKDCGKEVFFMKDFRPPPPPSPPRRRRKSER